MPKPPHTAHLLKKSSLENFIFCAVHDLELAQFSILVMNLLYSSSKLNNSITWERSNVSRPPELRMILSDFTILGVLLF